MRSFSSKIQKKINQFYVCLYFDDYFVRLRTLQNVTILFQKLKSNESNNQNRQLAFFDIKLSQTIQLIDSFELLKTSKNKLTHFR